MLKKLTIGLVLVFSLFMFSGCASMEGGLNIDPSTTQGLIVEQAVDTFGYTLGLFAAKDPTFKSEVEKYYNLVKANGLTVAITNEILQKFRDKDIAYQILAYKMTSLIRVMGGRILPDGQIESFGTITDHYIEIGKNAYLIAIQNSK